MAEKWKDLSQANKEAHLDSTAVMEKAILSQSRRHGAVTPVLSLDVIFIILNFLPTEVVLRLKTVCRAWSQLISDPLFIRAHSSRPAPITGFFIRTRCYWFHPFQTSPRFPSMITAFLSSGFESTCTSHGLVCFQRNKDGVIIVANPATSHWALIPSLVAPSPSPHCTYAANDPALIYDPIISLHFKVAIGIKYMTGSVDSTACDHRIRFHVYSSETSSWAVSSVYPDRKIGPIQFGDCSVSRIGGGSVCWEQLIYLWGYEIASDAHWYTPIPTMFFGNGEQSEGRRYLVDRDGETYCACFSSERKKVKVLRLDEEKSWILEGERNIEELPELYSYNDFPLVSYDRVRKALIVELENTRELIVLHLSSPGIESVGKCESKHWGINLPYANTLAPFHGSKQDEDGLNQLLHAVELDGDDDSVRRVETNIDDDSDREYESEEVECIDDDLVHDP